MNVPWRPGGGLLMFIQPVNYDAIAQDAIAHGTSISPLTEDGLVSIRDYWIAYIDKPLQYGVNDSWAYFFWDFAVFVAPWSIRQLRPESTLRDLLIVFPVNAVNAHEVFLMPVDVQSVFCNQSLVPALCIALATIIALLVSSIIAYKAFRNYQTVG